MKKLTKNSGGFTIVEIMVVVAIIGVLAGIAIPAYNSHMTKAKAAELFAVGAATKQAVAEYRVTKGSMPSQNSDLQLGEINSKYVSSVSVGTGGVITITGDQAALGADSPISVELSPTYQNGTVQWTCSYDGDPALVPKNCQSTESGSNNAAGGSGTSDNQDQGAQDQGTQGQGTQDQGNQGQGNQGQGNQGQGNQGNTNNGNIQNNELRGNSGNAGNNK